DKLERYDWPGDYAKRFDGVDRAGGDRPDDLDHVFEDNRRTAEVRMQEEALPGLVVEGASDCGHFVAGPVMARQRLFNGYGGYLPTAVDHEAPLGENYRAGGPGGLVYHTRFTCTPAAVPFRHERRTPRPAVHGTQTAVVVGPPGEEVFTDKYG